MFIWATICAVAAALATTADAHGYLSRPAARQFKCFRDGRFWWPETGEDIPDEACRRAYRTVYAKYRSAGESGGVAANAAQYMFQQYFEYAALAGADYQNLEHVQENVVAADLCAAGASDRSRPFGDKSGIDEPFDDWRADTLYPRADESASSRAVALHFCPTTVHEPSFFQIFISREAYNYTRKLTWRDLELVENETPARLIANDGTDENCASPSVYALEARVPLRPGKFVLYVRWQRRDVAGEGFYNCADVTFDANSLGTLVRNRDEL
ncbi:Ld-gp37 [Lymantria dispar multiple nucleopolyhedrovirus]|uniref:Ld-gp37 n=1 Tax=Lymantria dispar multicapsid nuclear polyhedrosis virus TaxID=10449 RepID=Q9YMQ9_NPVLD|nr:Ld-gp37 [Lymantria dispar multiple nucleopolyhedrovirus]AAC70254.1 Ld-gp37 [Lymantria dispar multiple nucleopolyhedrovirus]